MKKIILIIITALNYLSSFSQHDKQTTSKIIETNYLEFHSNYLVNLHHSLFKKALIYSFYKNENQKQFDTLFAEIKTTIDEKSKTQVMAAVTFYVDSLSKRDMLFDEELSDFKISLQQSTTFNELKTKTKSTQIVAAMQNFDAFYQNYYWREQDKKNREFVSLKIETIKQVEVAVIANCSKYYQYKFTGKKFRIDLTDYATFFSAYTTTEPYVSATISSTSKKHEGTQGIEVIFHEISHAMFDSVYTAQQNICIKNNLPLDNNVWHSILFYSTGVFVKNALAQVGEEHELYLYKNKLSSFNPSVKKITEVVAEYWPQYLEGNISMQIAIEHILLN